jgi:hypothetical protein
MTFVDFPKFKLFPAKVLPKETDVVNELYFGWIPYTIEVLNSLISTRLPWYLGVIKGLRLSTKVERLFVNNEILNCNQIYMILDLDINICTFVIT